MIFLSPYSLSSLFSIFLSLSSISLVITFFWFLLSPHTLAFSLFLLFYCFPLFTILLDFLSFYYLHYCHFFILEFDIWKLFVIKKIYAKLMFIENNQKIIFVLISKNKNLKIGKNTMQNILLFSQSITHSMSLEKIRILPFSLY